MGQGPRRRLQSLMAAGVFALATGLTACGSTPPPAQAAPSPAQSAAASQSQAPQSSPAQPYQAPPFADSPFHEEAAQVCGAALLDASAADQGYIGAKSQSSQSVVILVDQGEGEYQYWLPVDGTPVALPLNMGDGGYQLRVMENISGSTYAETWAGEIEVALQDEYQPFLRPSQMVSYTQDSDCVALAAQLAAQSEDSTALAGRVYAYLVENIVYDDEKAATVQNGYLPSPDETLASGKGICFDYAALAAAMLRSQGVPTRLITGYVAPDGIYHAWNQIYIQGQGWITVEIKAQASQWQRVDITFAAAGADTDFLTDDANYTDRFVY